MTKKKSKQGKQSKQTKQPKQTKQEKQPMVFIACVNNTAMVSEYVSIARFGVGWMLGASGIRAVFRTFDSHPISNARNEAVDEFLKSKSCTKCGRMSTSDKCPTCNIPTEQFSHLYFWDSDNVPNPNIVNRLLSYDEPVVAGWYLCYSDDTEVLTVEGWKLIKDVKKRDLLFTLNPETKEIEYNIPYDKFEYGYEGEMFHQTSRDIDLLVTPNHYLWVKPTNYQSRGFDFIQAKKSWRRVKYHRGGTWKGIEIKTFILPSITKRRNNGKEYVVPSQRIPMDNWLKFFGIYLAEGSIIDTAQRRKDTIYEISIAQKNIERKSIVKNWIQKCGFHCFEENHELRIRNKQLFIYLRQFGKSDKKFVPRELKQLSRRQLKIFFDAYLLGDGKRTGANQIGVNGYVGLSSNSKKLIDDFQEILLKIGLAGVARVTPPNKNENRPKPHYNLSVNPHIEVGVNGTKDNRKLIPYNGKVYCLEVRNHLLFVRRNGKVCWCSNSRGAGGLPVILKITDKKLPKSMNEVLKENAMSYYYDVKDATKPWTPSGFPTWEAMRLSEFMTIKLDKKGLRPVDGAGAGALLIKRETLSHLEQPYFYEDHLYNHSFGEDLWFSLNCKIHGIPIKVDPQSFVGHFAFGVIDSRHLKQFLRNEITKDQTQKIFKQK